MGITIHYQLRLPGETHADDVTQTLARLRDFALTQPFAEVSDLAVLADGSQAWSRSAATVEFFALLNADCYRRHERTSDVCTARGFVVQPGKGCETATFCLMLRGEPGTAQREWLWHCSCKTQFASIESDEHLV